MSDADDEDGGAVAGDGGAAAGDDDPTGEQGGTAADRGGRIAEPSVPGAERVPGSVAVDDRAAAAVGVLVAAAVVGAAALPGPAGWRPVGAVLLVGAVVAFGLRYRGALDRLPAVAFAALAVGAVLVPGPADWQPLAAVAGGAAGLAFGLRRVGAVDRLPGAVLAAVASLAVAGYGFWRLFVASAAGTTPGPGPWVAVGAGLLGVVLAYADAVAIPGSGLVSRVRGTLVGVALGATGFLGIVVWAYVLAIPVAVVTGGVGDVAATAVSAVGLGLGTGTVGLLYLFVTDRPLSYIDFRLPDRWDVAYALVGVFALFGALVGLSALFALLGTSPAEHSVVQQAERNPAILLVLIPAAWLLIGPGEELLFRNVVQKSLYGSFSRPGAVLVASGIFALAHFQAYFDPDPLALLQSLGIVFVLSLLLGGLYVLSENTTVPAFVHGTYNAVLFLALYLGQTGGDGAAVVLLVP